MRSVLFSRTVLTRSSQTAARAHRRQSRRSLFTLRPTHPTTQSHPPAHHIQRDQEHTRLTEGLPNKHEDARLSNLGSSSNSNTPSPQVCTRLSCPPNAGKAQTVPKFQPELSQIPPNHALNQAKLHSRFFSGQECPPIPPNDAQSTSKHVQVRLAKGVDIRSSGIYVMIPASRQLP